MDLNLKQLAKYAARREAPKGTEFSVEDVNAAWAGELNKIAGNINNYHKHKYDIFAILIENADEVVPAKLIDIVGLFAEIKQVGQGQTVSFKTKLGRNRAKKFITQVGLSGVYETFRLDEDSYSIHARAVGGGVSIDFERMLDGADSLADLLDVVAEGLAENLVVEVLRALKAASAKAGVPAANRVIADSFDNIRMQKLVNTVKAYGGTGSSAVVFAPTDFIIEMGADAIVPPIAGQAQGIYSPDDIDAIHKTGLIKIFRGTPVVEMPQAFVDERNAEVWLDPQVAYVLPTGGEKVVKVVLEGQTQVWERDNRDQSIEIMFYKKMGVGIQTFHNWGIYQNTGIDNSNYVAR